MDKDLPVSVDDYWNSVIQSLRTSVSLLTPYQGKEHVLIDDAVKALLAVIEQGQLCIEKPLPEKPVDVATPSWKNHQLYDDNNNNKHSTDSQMESTWKQLTDNVIQVPLDNKKIATCIAVTTAEGLEAVIRDIYLAPYISIDCEMLALKKNLPELKLLQIGVSDIKGYAIQVDIVGFDILNDRLKPILEDQNINIVGWSYRSDGMAIESFFKQIRQAPVLDLQAKLRPIAVSELNLATAMDMYATSWEGLEVFRVAKRYGDSFVFTENNCVWLNTPLPPKALVYAVFDVLSVHALYDSTKDFPDSEKYYWPYTITNGSNNKAIDNWYRQRHKAVTSAPYTPPQSSPSHNSPSTSKPRNNNTRYQRKDKYAVQLPVELEPEPKTDDGYDDNDARHQLEIQKAIALSLKENLPSEQKTSTGDRVVGDLDESRPFETIYYQDTLQEKEPEVITSTWGDVNLNTSPFLGNNFASPEISNPKAPSVNSPSYSYKSPSLSNTTNNRSSPQTSSQPYHQYQSNNRYSRPVHTNNNNNNNNNQRYYSHDPKRLARPQSSPGKTFSSTPPPQATLAPSPQATLAPPPQSTLAPPPSSTLAPPPQSIPTPGTPKQQKLSQPPQSPQYAFKNKPDKDKHVEFQSYGGGPQQQTVSFSYSEPDATGSTAASWKSFANSTTENWKKGIDTEINEMEQAVKQNASVGHAAKQEASKDSWVIEENKPDIMTIPLKQIPVRKVFPGPRVVNPADDYEEDDDDDDDYSDDSDSEEERMRQMRKNAQPKKVDEVTFGVKVTPDMKVKGNGKKEKKFRIEKLEIFVDDLYLYGSHGPNQLAMLKMTALEHLDMIHIPDVPYTVTLGFHMFDAKGSNTLKALQLYISTGESYTCVVEQACLISNQHKIQSTVFGKLLTDPRIKRICWYPEFIEDEVRNRLGFPLGPCVDLASKINHNRPEHQMMSFKSAIDTYLSDWQDLDQYNEFKADYDNMNSLKKFSGSPWDRDRLPEVVLKYSALQGLASYSLYKVSLTMNLDDADFIWP